MNDPNTDRIAQDRYRRASIKTADNLQSVARQVSRLTLPEIDATVDLVSRIVPAGNVPGVILNGLARLSGRRPPREVVRRDVKLLFEGVEQILDKAIYGAFFAGPAAVIWGYQNLLKLAGKEPEAAFSPEGTWQFYVDYALREDTARHANETHGFDTALREHGLQLDPADRITAWVVTAIHGLHQYDALLENEWRERVATYALRQIGPATQGEDPFARLYTTWERQRPYGRAADTGADEDYPRYRRRKFDEFMQAALQQVDPATRGRWEEQVRAAEERDLPNYLRQMTILAYLLPETYGEVRTPVPLENARVGVVYKGNYYLVPVCARDSTQPPNVETIRRWIAALVAQPSPPPPANLIPLARLRRTALANLRGKLSQDTVKRLDQLRCAPILLNFDPHPRELPLAELRQDERGVGDHALTLFDTGETMVFDQSHIFFDGAWGAALAEIMTNEALSWAVYLSRLPPAEESDRLPVALPFRFTPDEVERIRKAPTVIPEVGVENDRANVGAMLKLRRLFKQRSDLLQLTVNDLLVLFRAIHAVTYRPSENLREVLDMLAGDDNRALARAAEVAWAAISPDRPSNPAILIPVDASQRAPSDRLYPMSFEVPLEELDLIRLHDQVIAALDAYEISVGDRTAVYAEFDRLQRRYLASLAGFGQVMSRAKELAIAGESGSVGTIKLLAHMPTPLQRLLDAVPSRFELLNDIIKGREVFSNVGAVARTSTLTRFITAKDDNEKKTLAWGVITDAAGVMRVSLRDFRPHVRLLIEAGLQDIARQIAQEYLDTYARHLNGYIQDLWRITKASRETRLAKPDE